MASVKPNDFPLIPSLDGTEEVYTQTDGINGKFTVQQIIDLVPLSSGGTQTLAQTLTLGNTTSGEDIIMSNDDVIKAASGGGRLNLRLGDDNVIDLTTDNGAYTQSWIYMDVAEIQAGYSNSSYFEAKNNGVAIKMAKTANFSYFSDMEIGVATISQVGVIGKNIAIYDNVGGSISTSSSVGAVNINSGTNGTPTVFGVNVVKSPAMGGQGLTIKTNYTPYTNQISYQQSGNLYDTIIAPSNATADRLQTLQDKSGTIALLSDIPTGSTQTLAQTLVLGNTTDGNDIIMSSGDVIEAAQGGGHINLRAFNGDGIVTISTDNGALLQSFVGLTEDSVTVAHTDKSQLVLDGDSVLLHGYFTDPFVKITESYFKVEDYVTGSTQDSAFAIYSIATKIVQHCNLDINPQALFLNTGTQTNPTTFLSSVTNSVAVGGKDYIVKTDNSIYSNQLALVEAGSLFENIISPSSGNTQDNIATLPNTSGTIVLHNITGTTVSSNAIEGQTILATAGVVGITITLPTPSNGQIPIKIKKVDNAIGLITIDGNGSNIEGLATKTLTNQWDYLVLECDDTQWYVFGQNL